MSLFDRVIFVYEFVKIKFTNLVLFIIKKYIKFYNETDYLLLNNYNHMAQTVFGLLTCTDVTIYGQNGPIPPFLEIFSKETLFRK